MKRGLLFVEKGEWLLGGKKHAEKTLEEVADEDPGYLAWMYREAYDNLSIEAQTALDEIIEERSIKI